MCKFRSFLIKVIRMPKKQRIIPIKTRDIFFIFHFLYMLDFDVCGYYELILLIVCIKGKFAERQKMSRHDEVLNPTE